MAICHEITPTPSKSPSLRTPSSRVRSIALVLAITATGCSGPEFISTPNLYIDSEENPFANVPEIYQTGEVDVLYVTDRRPIEQDDGTVQYDHGRSYSMAFGSATVTFGEDVTWEELVKASRSRDREVSLPVTVARVEEKGRFPATPFSLVKTSESGQGSRGYRRLGLTPDPETVARYEQVAEALRAELRERLARSPRKDVFVYVHGYSNSFEKAVSVMAQTWHFLGRFGVPVAYSWPAGIGGLRGYFYDRESGEFTIFHLKEFMRILASCDEIEKVHLIAHSRGTDVTMTALREISIEMRSQAQDPNRKRKLGHVIVAAPDLDLDVISQRFVAEELSEVIDDLTVYMSGTDTALGLSTWIFVSQQRVGRVTSLQDLPPEMQARMTPFSRVEAEEVRKTGYGSALIDARVEAGFIGHSYYYSNPAVLSDVILILRYGRTPGAENGRPLKRRKSGMIWRIYEEYPRPEPD